MLKSLGESGGPEEDRTPDLLIANEAAVLNINDLRRCINVENSVFLAIGGTSRAQSKAGLTRAASNGPNHNSSRSLMNKRPEKAPVRHEYWTDKAIARRQRLKAESGLPESKPLPRFLLPRGDSGCHIDNGRGPSGWQNAPVRVPIFMQRPTCGDKEVKRARYERMRARRYS